MIDVFSWATPNGHKVHIMLEECGFEYKAHAINIGNGDQFGAAFLGISPNNKIPAIVDQDGPAGQPISIFESGAILMYLAQKSGKFMPTEPRAYYAVLQWLMFQMGGLGPMLGQANHFRKYAPEPIEYAIKRYTKEAQRLYRVMDTQLEKTAYLAGDEYSIADIACYPWVRGSQIQGIRMETVPNVKAWFDRITEREAVQRGVKVLVAPPATPVDEAKRHEMLFGDAQYQKR